MKKNVTFSVDADVYEKFCVVLALSGEEENLAVETCLHWYTERVFEQNSKDTTRNRNEDLVEHSCSQDFQQPEAMDRKKMLSLKNKDFAYTCVAHVMESARKEDIEILANAEECKRRFDMNYPILQEIKGYGDPEMYTDSSGNRRYYPDVLEYEGHRYIVCNDWYYNGKASLRDTRSAFLNWVMRR